MSYDICIWDPYAFERPQDYIPDSLEHAEYIRWEELLRKIKLSPNPKLLAFGKELGSVDVSHWQPNEGTG